ncbi:hypothetical protein ATCC90586_001792 [Pythium insidiosum]|nr:hypothetical protein ATCC90586_001792 [Pythium insidiosum]
MARKRATSHLKRNRPKGSGTALTDALELRIVGWVNLLRGDGVPITSLMLRIKAKAVATAAGIVNFVASAPWQRRLAMRTRTRQGQTRPEDAAALAAAFAAKVMDKMKDLGVTVLYNADQTAEYYDLDSTKRRHLLLAFTPVKN